MKSLEEKAQQLLVKAGVTINGPEPYDIQVRDKALYARAFSQGTLGVGEAYMDGMWDAEDLAEFFNRVLKVKLDEELYTFSTALYFLRAKFQNMQTVARAYQVGEEHYDIGNDLFVPMLGPTLAYSCGYWSSPNKPAHTLEEAQEAKYDLICRKVGLKEDDTILEIGCGWGMFLKYAAEHYGVKGVGITVSKEQAALAREKCKGLPVEIRVEDYRSTKGQFDHIISIGMFEHVGPKNYRTYFEVAHKLLKRGGIFLLHTIGGNRALAATDPWLNKYIFPNGVLPSPGQLAKAIEGLFVMEDWHNFGPDYDKTLCAWFENFDRAWPSLKTKYGERFYRMWKFYLLSCAGLFRSREAQLWHVVLSKGGVPGGYKTVR